MNSRRGQANREKTCIAKYGAKSSLLNQEVRERGKSTMIEKYGVDHPMHSSAIKAKVGQTKNDRYGDTNFNNREKFKATVETWDDEKRQDISDKRKNTNLERYGVEFITQHQEFKERSAESIISKYGVDNASKNPEIISKIKKTMLDRYGCHYNQTHIDPNSLKLLSDPDYLQRNADRSLIDLAQELGVTYYTVGYWYNKHSITRTFNDYNKSLAEAEINDFIKSYNFETITNSRKIIDKKEIDIFIPSLNLGIEYNGLYWHSEINNPDQHYHKNKLTQCREVGIDLIQITDYEYKHKKDIVLSRIKSRLGVNTTIYARKTTIAEISSVDAKAFLDKNHIQGSVNGGVKLGLHYNGILVAVMTFGKSRYSKKYQYELLRYCNLLGHNVVGGASKLFTYFIQKYNPGSIVSYCDLRWNSGNLYEKLGFNCTHHSEPNYWYTFQYATFESRVKYQKHKLSSILEKYDENLSEWENMNAAGFDRIWDCGNSVWEWIKK
jgi:hypothetical protein